MTNMLCNQNIEIKQEFLAVIAGVQFSNQLSFEIVKSICGEISSYWRDCDEPALRKNFVQILSENKAESTLYKITAQIAEVVKKHSGNFEQLISHDLFWNKFLNCLFVANPDVFIQNYYDALSQSDNNFDCEPSDMPAKEIFKYLGHEYGLESAEHQLALNIFEVLSDKQDG